MINLRETNFPESVGVPTSEECVSRKMVFENSTLEGYAYWYPQMGGYVAKAIAFFDKYSNENECVDVFVWHDGQFPFGAYESPRRLHHCLGEQFITFGKFLMSGGKKSMKETYDLK